MRDRLAGFIVVASQSLANIMSSNRWSYRVACVGSRLADAITVPLSDSEWDNAMARPKLAKLYSRGILTDREIARLARIS